jgi:NADH-quinone oxidoreductase subunit F
MLFDEIQPRVIASWRAREKRETPRITNGGYSGLKRALGISTEAVIAEIADSGLRGRGGAGFPTATKWRACHETPEGEKYMIANGAEGDPEAKSVKMLLESDPHAVLEGMLIGAYAVGAGRGIIFFNGNHTEGIARVRTALAQAEALGLAGENILGSGFSCRIQIFEGGNGFVCGVETAMIRALEKERPMPYIRPPYPAISGLNGKPTCVNSAETLAHVSAILQKGAAWYRGFGTEKSSGTKLFTLTGQIAHPGVIEVAMGTTLRRIIEEIGGGVAGGRELKAVQIGGPTGGFLPADALDLPLDFEHLFAAGAIMGSGRIMVVDDRTCMIELAKNCLSFGRAESCGKCVLCREGSAQLLTILTDITAGKGNSDDIELFKELCEGMQTGSICGLGRTAPNPVLTLMKYFREELDAHLKKKRCPALVCRKFITYHILGEKCRGCGLCRERCPEEAIAGDEGMIHVIDPDACTKCGICFDVCPAEYGAVTKAGGVKPRTPAEPVPVGSWKKR